jgi:hypothetical protein
MAAWGLGTRVANDWNEEEDLCMSSALLLDAPGVHKKTFPKSYKVKLTAGFYGFLTLLSVFLFGATAVAYSRGEVPLVTFNLDLFVLLVLFGGIVTLVPRRVVRENTDLLVAFCFRTVRVPIESIDEVRIIRGKSLVTWSVPPLLSYGFKCFWGYPTDLGRSVIVVTDTAFSNFYFSLEDLDEFVADNCPQKVHYGPALGKAIDLEDGIDMIIPETTKSLEPSGCTSPRDLQTKVVEV